MQRNILVTGGAGFIGSSFVNMAKKNNHNVYVLDKLTYSGNKENLTWIRDFDLKKHFYLGDIKEKELVFK